MIKTVRTKASILFAAGFTMLWIVCNTFLFWEFHQTLWDNFDSQMRNNALQVAGSTGINPRLVPLPEEGENFMLIYTDAYETVDTLFVPPPELYSRLLSERNVSVESEIEEGTLTVIYSMSAEKVEASIRKIIFLFVGAFIVEIILSILLGYWLSGKVILQNAFFASASHELRTPLSVMQTGLQVLLSGGQLSHDTRQVFEKQLAEVKRMTNMVNDFLLMSELQNDKMKTIKTECDLSDILTTIISRHKQKTMERGLNFKISFTPEEESFSIVADKEKLFIILSNLIINSLKYSQENGIIEIRFEKTGTHHITVSIRNKIRDGITPKLAALKKSFYHSKPANVEGIGLGLWIANRLSEINGFTMSVSIDGDWFEVSLRMLEVV